MLEEEQKLWMPITKGERRSGQMKERPSWKLDCKLWKQMLRIGSSQIADGWISDAELQIRDGKESYHKRQITKTKDVKYKD